jgi:hypothetical protein
MPSGAPATATRRSTILFGIDVEPVLCRDPVDVLAFRKGLRIIGAVAFPIPRVVADVSHKTRNRAGGGQQRDHDPGRQLPDGE